MRRVPGVAAGVQYTIPSPEAVERAGSGERPELTTREKHTRHCYVVLAEDADADTVEQAIITMPDYFVDLSLIHISSPWRQHVGRPHGRRRRRC